MLKKIFRSKLFKILSIIALLIGILFLCFVLAVRVNPPKVEDTSALKLSRKTIGKDFYTCNKSWLKKNKFGLWEMYLEGDDFELGVQNGILAKDLIKIQEDAFVKSIKEIVPSESYLGFLKYFLAWFNRNMDTAIPLEYQKEIYGISLYASHEYDYISNPYHRILNYHGAHDIGHAVQNMHLVECTAFGVKSSRSTDGSMLVGRNMDFYVGEEFAKNKIVAFYKPKHGHKFSFITWGGMIGVISGMNDQGLTITLNSASSDIPTSAKTPVSILARRILQYASTIDEAYKIAEQTNIFVAESFFISSAKDKQFAIIEKTPDSMALYQEKDDDLILTNHFQSEKLKNTEHNKKSIKESASMYRWNRVKELMDKQQKHDVVSIAQILRNQKGKNDANIGLCNEKAVNQLICHHSIIFQPEKLKFWVAAPPYQLGNYVAYDLNKIFADSLNIKSDIFDSNETLPADSFENTVDFKNAQAYRAQTFILWKKIRNKAVNSISISEIENYIKLNPEFFNVYYIAGECFRLKGDKTNALKNYKTALQKEIPTFAERNKIIKAIESLKE